MQTDFKQLPKSEFLITITLTEEELAKYEEAAAKRISERVDVPGFRRGQAPKAFIIAQIGTNAFFEETVNLALPHAFFQAVQEKKLNVISRPHVKITSKTPLIFEARTAVFPDITIKSIEDIKIPSEPIHVTEKEIDEVVLEMRKYRATYKPIERSIQKGDRLEIDFEGFDEGGASLEKTKSKNHPLFVGEGTLVPGFEEELIGMKVSEKKKFPVKFPKDFHHEPLRAKKVHFEVEVKRAEEPILPALDEAFIADVMGQKKSVAEFQEAIKIDMHRKKEADARKNRENALLEKLLKEAKFDVPPLLIDEEIDYMIQDLKGELEGRKLNFESYLEKLKKENRDLRKEYEKEAEKRIRIRLILNYIFRTLSIDVSDEEMQTAEQKLLERTPEQDRSKLLHEMSSKGELYLRLKNNLMLEKMFVKFLGL